MNSKYIHILLFFFIAIICIGSIKYGYFFHIDYSPLEKPYYKYVIDIYTPFSWFLFNGLPYFIPSWFFQRLIYIVTLFLLWVWWYKLLESKTKIWAYFSWIIMMINPFVYSRFMDWQIWVILAIVMCLFFFIFLLQYFEYKKDKLIIYSSIFWAFAVLWMPHSLFFILWSLLVFLSSSMFKIKDIKFYLKTIFIYVFFIILLNFNWLLWISLWKGNVASSLSQINLDNFNVFSSDKGENIYFNVLSLHGFWWERQQRYMPTYYTNTRWEVLFLLIFWVVLYWIYLRVFDKRNNEKILDCSLLIIWIVSYILALGISNNNIFAVISQFLYDYIPFYKWLREPQKWVWILLIVYARFWAFWVQWIYQVVKYHNFYPKLIWFLLIILPIFYTPTMLWGFNWQLKISDYPQERYNLKRQIEDWNIIVRNDTCDYQKKWLSNNCYDILSLPRHQYIWLGFVNKVVVNPTDWFFYPFRVLQWDNIEIWNIYSQSLRLESKIIEKYLWPWGQLRTNNEKIRIWIYNDFIRDLRGLWIGYILLLKESDFIWYYTILNNLEEFWFLNIEEENNKLVFFSIN